LDAGSIGTKQALTAEQTEIEMSAGSENLKANQRQLDMDGCEVGVSRQALDETLAEYDAMLAALRLLVERIDVNGGIGEYKGGPAFVMVRARDAIAKAGG
jgi:hypothetical protein